MDSGRLDREREFHDELAAELDPTAMPPRPAEGLDEMMLRAAGGVAGRRVLDLGCGDGELTLAVLLQSPASVAALDLSPGMVDVTRRRVSTFFPSSSVEYAVSPAETMPFDDGAFDVIIGRYILHHLDLQLAPKELARVLAPGGVAVFVENSGRNPVLRFARDHIAGRFGVPRFGTADEEPLRPEDLEHLHAALPATRLEYPVFHFFEILDRQVFRYRYRPLSRLCRALDAFVWRAIPPLRSYSFRTVVRASRG